MIYLRWLWDAWLVGPRLVDGRVFACNFQSFVCCGVEWGNDVHVTLCMYLLLRHGWGGVGAGWDNNVHVKLRSAYTKTLM